MGHTKTKSLPEWATRARKLRQEHFRGISQEDFARRLGVSTSEVRRWEQGRRAPSAAQAIALGRAEGPPGCWYWWKLAGLSEAELRAALASVPAGERRAAGAGRVSAETSAALMTALETLLERAPSAVIEEVARMLTDRAGKYGEERPPRKPPR